MTDKAGDAVSAYVPRTGKNLTIATKAFARESRSKSWWVVLSTLFLFFANSACIIIAPYLAIKIGLSIVSGLLMVRMFVIYHDFQHGAILHRSKGATSIMWGVGMLSLAPSSVWRSSHNHHHAHNSKLRSSHIGSYPIMTRKRFQSASSSERRQYLFMRHPLTIFVGYFTTFGLGMCLLPFLRHPREQWEGLLALVLHACIMATIWHLGGFMLVVLLLLIPFTLAMGLGSYLFYAQHNFPEVVHTDNAGWTHHGAAMEASSFMRMPSIMHWFTANIGYHHIHHLNAKIPFYRLPEVMRNMPELQTPNQTSLHPREILRCLRLKVWNCQTGGMEAL